MDLCIFLSFGQIVREGSGKIKADLLSCKDKHSTHVLFIRIPSLIFEAGAVAEPRVLYCSVRSHYSLWHGRGRLDQRALH